MSLKLKYGLPLIFVLTGYFEACNTPLNDRVEEILDADGCLITKEAVNVNLKTLGINFFLETSGSMSGFMDKKGTTFQKDIWSVVERLDTKFPNGFNLYEVRSKSEPINPMTIDDFRSNLNMGGVISGSSTDIPEMLDSIVSKANNNTVSILVSDLIFSPEDGNTAQMMQITTDIRKRFSDKKRSTILLQSTSEFYKRNSKIEGSPYYLWIMGEPRAVSVVAKLLKAVLSTQPNEIDMGVLKPRPRYSILPSESAVVTASPLICTKDENYYVYSEFTPEDTGEMKFWVGVDLSDLPGYMQDASYLKLNLSIEARDARASIIQVSEISGLRHSDDIKIATESNLTHMIQVQVSEIATNTLISINGKKIRPKWLDSINLEVEDNQRIKTYGLMKMVNGLEAAYGGSSEKNFFCKPLEILITPNKN